MYVSPLPLLGVAFCDGKVMLDIDGRQKLVLLSLTPRCLIVGFIIIIFLLLLRYYSHLLCPRTDLDQNSSVSETLHWIKKLEHGTSRAKHIPRLD